MCVSHTLNSREKNTSKDTIKKLRGAYTATRLVARKGRILPSAWGLALMQFPPPLYYSIYGIITFTVS